MLRGRRTIQMNPKNHTYTHYCCGNTRAVPYCEMAVAALPSPSTLINKIIILPITPCHTGVGIFVLNPLNY